jgi:hypothetical protein
MYRMFLEGTQVGGPVSPLCGALSQLDAIKKAGFRKVTDLENVVGINIDGLKLIVVDEWCNPIPAVKYKKEEK